MTIFKRYIYLVAVVVLAASCDFGDTNLSPTSVTAEQVTLPLILPKAQVQTVYNTAATAGRMAGIFMQQLEGVEAQQAAISNYAVVESDFNNTWSGQLYVGAMRDNITILEKALAPGSRSNHYAGVARIMLAHNLGFATQLWGDVPYTEAFLGSDNLNPTYDTQESIFASIQTLLDSAIANLNAPVTGVPLDEGQDLIFAGNTASWIATARSMKARYYLMLSKRNGNAAYTSALAQIAAGVIADADDSQPDFDFGTSANDGNPISLMEQDRAATLQFGPNFANVLVGDPRAAVYYEDDGRLLYAGDDLFWGRNESPLNLISYSEVKFIEAEARLMTGDLAGAGLALNEAVKSNMHQVGLDSSSAAVSTYLGTNGGFGGATTQAARLDRIITEKYKALYGQGMTEVWSDYRRTGLPSFIVPKAGASISVLPRRLPYPQNERLTNGDSHAAATANQGGAELENDMWAFQ